MRASSNFTVPTVDESIIMQGPFCSARKVDAFTGATISVRPSRRIFFGDVHPAEVAPDPGLALLPDPAPTIRDEAARALEEINNRKSAPSRPAPAPRGLFGRILGGGS
jgi:hypothetical protein